METWNLYISYFGKFVLWLPVISDSIQQIHSAYRTFENELNDSIDLIPSPPIGYIVTPTTLCGVHIP